MQFAHTEVLFLFLKELHGAISKIMFISILDSKLHGLGAFIIFMSCGISSFFIKLVWSRWYAILGMYDLAVKHMLEVLACSHQSKITQEFFLRDFLQIVQVSRILVIILYDYLFIYFSWYVIRIQ
jgi:hypothetical protein